MNPMFPLGRIRITNGALEALGQSNISADSIIQRHVLGDWGDISDEEKQSNDLAVEMGGRISSTYSLPDGTRVWVYTEGDRRETTILLPDDN
jgi:hypothetical protein